MEQIVEVLGFTEEEVLRAIATELSDQESETAQAALEELNVVIDLLPFSR